MIYDDKVLGVQKLRDVIGSLPSIPGENKPFTWDRYRNSLREHVLTSNPAYFMDWPEIASTMRPMMSEGWMRGQMLALKDSDLLHYASPVNFGSAKRDVYYNAEGVLINQLYNLHITRALGFVRYADTIVEIGAGFGAMPLICERLGFSGAYYVIDFPEFVALQNFYLENVGAKIRVQDVTMRKGGVLSADMLLAFFSLSEIGLGERERIAESVSAKQYAVGFQDAYGGIDNRKWFADWVTKLPIDHEIISGKHLSHNYVAMITTEPHRIDAVDSGEQEQRKP